MRVGPRAYSVGPPEKRSRIAVCIAVAALTLYAAALRADVLVTRLGATGDAGVAALVERVAAPIGARLRPRSVVWKYDPNPYTGDPINYIRFAREMQGFYQPHVREPMFLALTRGFLHLLNNRDIAVSYASAFSSSLVVPAIYLLGAAAFGPVVGLLAAGAWAIEFEAISWSADGWRDDTFTLFFTLSAWSYVRLRQDMTPSSAIAAGIAAAAACLTRLSSLLFAAAGLVWVIVEPASNVARAHAARMAAIAALLTTLIAGPYVASCWLATGDPFYAVNYHTRYYRHAEGLRGGFVPESATHFVARQFHSRPIAAFDTAAGGLFSWPFASKWHGFGPWSPELASVLRWSAGAGLVVFLWSTNGRLLLVLLLTSLAPYALTYSLGGGGAWRFSEHVYPIYLTAAFCTWRLIGRAALAAVGTRSDWRSWRALLTRRRVTAGALTATAAVLVLIAYYALPLLITREALAASDASTIEAGARERWFFTGTWSAPRRSGPVVVRVAEATETGFRFALHAPTALRLTLKMDPPETADPGRQPSVLVFLNRRRLGEVRLTRDPVRMGAYRFEVPVGLTRGGLNSLQLVSSHTVPAREGGRPFRWLGRETPVAFRLWYVRLEAFRQ
jgi:4-amino-4-deoxy-L-arabinose transferase-like glycosyltransferase